jgi:hypothetical protein
MSLWWLDVHALIFDGEYISSCLYTSKEQTLLLADVQRYGNDSSQTAC